MNMFRLRRKKSLKIVFIHLTHMSGGLGPAAPRSGERGGRAPPPRLSRMVLNIATFIKNYETVKSVPAALHIIRRQGEYNSILLAKAVQLHSLFYCRSRLMMSDFNIKSSFYLHLICYSSNARRILLPLNMIVTCSNERTEHLVLQQASFCILFDLPQTQERLRHRKYAAIRIKRALLGMNHPRLNTTRIAPQRERHASFCRRRSRNLHEHVITKKRLKIIQLTGFHCLEAAFPCCGERTGRAPPLQRKYTV
eukprot:284819861_4